MISAANLVTWIKEPQAHLDRNPDKLLLSDSQLNVISVVRLLPSLGSRDIEIREAAIRRLLPCQDVGVMPIIEALEDSRLSNQLSVIDFLLAWKAPANEIDLWQPDSINPESLKRLRDRAASLDLEAKPSVQLTGAELMDMERVIDRLLVAPDSQVPGLIEQLSRGKRQLLPAV